MTDQTPQADLTPRQDALRADLTREYYALFGLGAATALAFWFLDVLMKGYQLRYYGRMRDIEVAAHHLNAVRLGDLGLVSAAPALRDAAGVPAPRGRGLLGVGTVHGGPPGSPGARPAGPVNAQAWVTPSG